MTQKEYAAHAKLSKGQVSKLAKRGMPLDSPEAAALAGSATTLRLLPHVHGTDGYFLASLRRKEEDPL